MSASKLCPSVALLRSLGLSSHLVSRRCVQQTSMRLGRAIHSSASSQEDQKSFKGQLYESTYQRLERERAEQRRFAKERGQSSGSRTAATTFGDAVFACNLSGLTSNSLRCDSVELLLPWILECIYPFYRIDHATGFDGATQTQHFSVQFTSRLGRFRWRSR